MQLRSAILAVTVPAIALAGLGCSDIFSLRSASEPYALWISDTGLVLEPGESARLSVWAEPTKHALRVPIQADRWWTENEAVIGVDDNGVVDALTVGRATVWIEAGARRDSATVLVRNPDEEPRTRWRSVAVGHKVSCALTEDGRAYCWGDDWYGELGTGNRREHTRTLAPVAVSGGHTFKAIDVADHHACALTTDGIPWCWGHLAQTGAGFWDDEAYVRSTPERVAFDGRFSQISTVFLHTCGLDENGTAFCWGNNFYGQLGLGTFDREIGLVPSRVDTDLRFATIAANWLHTCALTEDGAPYCWGDNQSAQLGHKELPAYAAPEPVAGGHRFVWLTSQVNNCGLDAEQRTYCWASHSAGLDIDEDDQYAPAPLLDDPGFDRIYAARSSGCGLMRDGSAHCWGINRAGALAIGIDASDRPLPVAGGHRFRELSLGKSDLHPSACGITLDGELYCWGSNRFGQLGNGSLAEYSPFPIRVVDPL
jgi:hypothetical protein